MNRRRGRTEELIIYTPGNRHSFDHACSFNKYKRADETPRHGAGEAHVVKIEEDRGGIVDWQAMVQDIVGCLEGEGFFDFGVGCEEEV